MNIKRIYLITCIIIVLVIVPIILYLYKLYFLTPIKIINDSKNYELSINPNSQYLDDIIIKNILKKNSSISSNPKAINRIVIHTTDKDRGQIRYIHKNINVKTLDYKVANNELLINWYLNTKALSQFDNDTISKLFLYDFLLAQKLTLSSSEEDFNKAHGEVNDIIFFIKDNPFKIKIL